MFDSNNGNRKSSTRNANKHRFMPKREKIPIHFSTVLFIIIAIYILIISLRYAFRDKPAVYTVLYGFDRDTQYYDALVLRNEEVVTSDKTGYLRYYVEEGDRVRVGANLCSLDEDGNFFSSISYGNANTNRLSDEDVKKLQKKLASLSCSFDLNEYDKLYNDKGNIQSYLLNLLYSELQNNQNDLVDPGLEYSLELIKADKSGLFYHNYDGYEQISAEQVTKDMLSNKDYKVNYVSLSDVHEKGGFIYRLVKDDKFSIFFEMTEDDVVKYWESKKVTVYFPEINQYLTGDFSFQKDEEGNRLCRVDFKEYAYQMANVRFTKINISEKEIYGLKVPESAVTSVEYYMIPDSYFMKQGTEYGVMMVQSAEDGTINPSENASFVPVNIAANRDGYYFVELYDIEEGTLIISPDSSEVYEVRVKQYLPGVFCVNKGYSVYKIVDILSETTDGYYLLDPDSSSIKVNDRIVINADQITKGETIY